MGRANTVVRGGVGIFTDIFPGTIATNFDTNSPLKNTFITSGAQLAPGLAGSAQTATTASNTAFVSGFNSGFLNYDMSALKTSRFLIGRARNSRLERRPSIC